MEVLESSTREKMPALRNLVAGERPPIGISISISISIEGKKWACLLTDFSDKRVEFFFGTQRHDENFCGRYDGRKREDLATS